jgi:hypothetical protein
MCQTAQRGPITGTVQAIGPGPKVPRAGYPGYRAYLEARLNPREGGRNGAD